MSTEASDTNFRGKGGVVNTGRAETASRGLPFHSATDSIFDLAQSN